MLAGGIMLAAGAMLATGITLATGAMLAAGSELPGSALATGSMLGHTGPGAIGDATGAIDAPGTALCAETIAIDPRISPPASTTTDSDRSRSMTYLDSGPEHSSGLRARWAPGPHDRAIAKPDEVSAASQGLRRSHTSHRRASNAAQPKVARPMIASPLIRHDRALQCP
jgi:hypothetical protein